MRTTTEREARAAERRRPARWGALALLLASCAPGAGEEQAWPFLELRADYDAAAEVDAAAAWSTFLPRFLAMARGGSLEAQRWVVTEVSLPAGPECEERFGWFERCLRDDPTAGRVVEAVGAFWERAELRPRILDLFAECIAVGGRREGVALATALVDAMWWYLVEPDMVAQADELLTLIEQDSPNPWLVDEARMMRAALPWQVPGGTGPDIAGSGPDGQRLRLSDHRGKVVVLDFWGFW